MKLFGLIISRAHPGISIVSPNRWAVALTLVRPHWWTYWHQDIIHTYPDQLGYLMCLHDFWALWIIQGTLTSRVGGKARTEHRAAWNKYMDRLHKQSGEPRHE